jgi:translation initiation factor IF-2
MDNRVKVKEIADELGIKPKEVLDICAEFKIEAKNHSSAITMEDAEKIINFHMRGERPAGFEAPKPVVVEPAPQKQPDAPKVVESAPQKEEKEESVKVVSKPSRDRKNYEIIKKANPVQAKPEIKKEEPKKEEPKRAEQLKKTEQPKKQKPQSQVVAKKSESIKISIDREFVDKEDENDDNDIVMLPDFSLQDKLIEDEEKPVPTKTVENQKAKSAIKKPQPRINAQNMARPQKKKKFRPKPEEIREEVSEIEIHEDIRVYEFAEKIGKPLGEVIKAIFNLGLMKTKNDFMDNDLIEILAEEFGITVNISNALEEFDYLKEYEKQDVGEGVERAPIVTIMGHVDHGKTTLLDKIRNTKVAAGEAGGITQHIGAYMVEKNGHKITFLDTPGHEAFTHMRARGAQVTDIAIVVVAADDGVMPQTKEAISHIKDAKVPFLVAVNKIDKPSANPDFVKTQLAEMGITPIEWGGEYEFVHISAKTGEGIDTLLDTILIQAEILELKANPKKNAKAIVVEASLEKGRGPVATVLVQDGTLKVGDTVVVGQNYGKVRAIIDDMGKNLKELAPSEPGQILGLDGVPGAGDVLVAVENEKVAREYAENIKEHQRQRELSKTTKATFDDLHHLIKEGKLKRLNIVLKADVQGSLEAIKASLEKIRNEEVKVHLVHSAVGGITESDVELAKAGENTLIIGFNVKPNSTIKDKADDYGVEIRSYSVIFELIDDIKALVGEMLSPIKELVSVGKAEVRNLFTVGKNLVIAGCMVTDGTVARGAEIRIHRNNDVVYEGRIGSLKRFKDDVKEVKAGFECGIVIDGYNEFKEGDVIEAFKTVIKAAVFEQSAE